MGAYLDGATIVLVTRTPTGVVISNASNTTTRLTQRLAGYGHVDFRVQTSAGDTEQFRVYIQPRAANPAFFLTAGSGGGITALDGDKGDVIVSSAGSTWTLDPASVASLNVFTDTLKGITPASGGGTSNFLRADGTWATPPGGGGGGGPVSDADYGDITVSSTGTVWTIDNNAVTLAKMADMATGSLIYRKTAGTGDPEVQTLATLKTDLGLTGTNSGDQTITLTGNVTGSGTGSFATTIAAGAVGLSQMANMATSSLIYRKTAGSGAPEVNTLATLKTDLGLTGTNSGDQTITLTGDVTGSGTGSFVTAIGTGVIVDADVSASAAIAYSKLASMTGGSVLLGNASSVPTVTALTGDVTVSNAGVTAIGSGVIVDGDVNASAAIALSKLATQGARTFVANSTASTAVPTAISVATAQGMVGQFDTVTAVNSATIDAGINHIRTSGYNAVGDGGGALYKRVAGTPTAGVNTKYITSSGGQRWELSEAQEINILQFGADRAGVTAANTAFQAAVDATISGSGNAFSNLVIPPGNYKFDAAVSIPEGRRIQWKGSGDVRLFTSSNIIMLEHLRGNNANWTNMMIENVWFEKLSGAGSSIAIKWAGTNADSNNSKITLNDCEIRGFWRGVEISWATGNVAGGFLYNNTSDFVFFRGTNFFGIHNVVSQLGDYFVYADDTTGDGISNSIFINACTSVFKKIDIRMKGFDAVNIVGGGCDLGGTNNGTTGTDTDDGTGEYAIYLDDCTNVNITNQYVSSATGASGQPNARNNRIGIELVNCEVTHIIGNRIVDNFIGVRTNGPASGAALLISGNNFRNNKENHVLSNVSKSGRISGNAFDNTPPRTGTAYEVYLNIAGVTHWIVTDNLFEGTTYTIVAASDYIVADNQFGAALP
jgi:hypothetical protein